MGSSPVTATTPSAPRRRLLQALDSSLSAVAPARPGDLLLAAFSGGTDSTALLLGLRELAPARGWRLLAAHVDHRLDAGSGARASAAGQLAATLGVELVVLDAGDVAPLPPEPGDAGGREAAARRLRYALLERLRAGRGARWLLTAHHADDQAETVLLRLLLGSGLAGLAAMPERRGTLARPLLGLRRTELAAVVTEAGLAAVEDPTNRDLAAPRNRLRHLLLPAAGPAVHDGAVRLAAAAAGARAAIERRIAGGLSLPARGTAARIALPAVRALPRELLPWALADLARRAGLPYPPRRRAVAELARQLDGHGEVACDAGGGWSWAGEGGELRLRPPSSAPQHAAFAYTLAVPGGVEIREAGANLRLTRQPVADWMRRGSPECAALDLPLAGGDLVTVRSRRPGDRLQPLGCAHRRRLKDLLIDRRVPRERRDRLPLLCVDEQVAWVPGVTVHHPWRLRPETRWAWVAEIEREGGGSSW